MAMGTLMVSRPRATGMSTAIGMSMAMGTLMAMGTATRLGRPIARLSSSASS